jgi:CRP-like cAMP-binding protein
MVKTRIGGGGILARKLNTFLPLSSDELKCLAEIQSQPFPVARGRQLTKEGQTGHKAFVLQEGWACSYKDLRDGARQIISFPIAGDIVGLRSVLLRTADHSFSALTDAVVTPSKVASRLPASPLGRITPPQASERTSSTAT